MRRSSDATLDDGGALTGFVEPRGGGHCAAVVDVVTVVDVDPVVVGATVVVTCDDREGVEVDVDGVALLPLLLHAANTSTAATASTA